MIMEPTAVPATVRTMKAKTSTTTDSTVPAEIVFEILSWLEVKTLSSFRCVCKSWSALISDPAFRRAHRQRQHRDRLLLLTTNKCSTVECSDLHIHSLDCNRGTLTEIASFDAQLDYPHTVSSCTGFVCMCDRSGGSTYICNPFARELTAISSRSRYSVAFGYVPSTDDYKALRIFEHDYDESTVDSDSSDPDLGFIHPYCFLNHGSKASVITVGKDRDWRPVGDPPFQVVARSCALSVALVNGAVHLFRWIDRDRHEEYERGIARFDLEREEWSVLPLPHFVSEKSSEYPYPDIVLREFERSLCLIDHDCCKDEKRRMIDIWLPEDYNDSNEWVKLYRIDVSPFLKPSTYLDVVPLVKTDDGRLLLQMIACCIYGSCPEDRLRFYDPQNGCFEDLNIEEKLSIADMREYEYLTFSTTIYSPLLPSLFP